MTTLDDVTTCAGMPLAPPSAATGACLILISTTMPASIGKAFRLEPGEHMHRARLGGGDPHRRPRGVAPACAHRPHAGGRVPSSRTESTNGTYLNGVSVSSAELQRGRSAPDGHRHRVPLLPARVLEPREEQLRQALSAARVGIWDWNAESGQVTWSEHVDRLLGLAVGKLSGRAMDLKEVVHPADLPRLRGGWRRRWSSAPRWTGVPHRARGQRLPVAVLQGRRAAGPGGAPARITGTVMDITARKQAEQELRRQALSSRASTTGCSSRTWRAASST